MNRHDRKRITESFKVLPGYCAARGSSTGEGSPAFIVASVALKRVAPDEELVLPEGTTQSTLRTMVGKFGVVERSVPIHFSEAKLLGGIARQIVDLNDVFCIEPPLTEYESLAVHRLIDAVEEIDRRV